MTLERVGPILARIALRIVEAPSQVDVPRPVGGSVSIRRFREGLLEEPGLRLELATDGYGPADIERLVHQAILEREFDDFSDRLSVIEDAYAKDVLTDPEMEVQVRELIVDAPKAAIVVERLRFAQLPKPAAPTPERVPTLTTAQVLAAWAAGLIPLERAVTELTERNYSEFDIAVLLALEQAKKPKPKAAAQKELSIAELNAMLPLGLVTAKEYIAELVSRGYTPDDALALLGLQAARALARAPTAPTAPAPPEPPAPQPGGAAR